MKRIRALSAPPPGANRVKSQNALAFMVTFPYQEFVLGVKVLQCFREASLRDSWVFHWRRLFSGAQTLNFFSGSSQARAQNLGFFSAGDSIEYNGLHWAHTNYSKIQITFWNIKSFSVDNSLQYKVFWKKQTNTKKWLTINLISVLVAFKHLARKTN